MESGNAKRQSSTQPQQGEFTDETSQMREETSSSALVAMLVCQVALLVMFAA